MTTIPCVACQESGEAGEFPCSLCEGTGTIDAFSKWGMTEGHHMGQFNMIVGLVATLVAVSDKLDDVMDKCNDIFEKVSEQQKGRGKISS